MLASLKSLFSPSAATKQAHAAYERIVAQSRQPVFYKDWQVEDSLDGRFDMISLHLSLILMRLESELAQPDVEAFYRALTELFFADMDRSLREMGASDTGVGIRVKNMAQAFYGRKKAYQETMNDETALGEVLRRNVYRLKTVRDEAVASLAAYMGRNRAALSAQPVDALMMGVVAFSG